MAAARLGFAEMFQPLYAHDHLKRGLIDGDLPSIQLFSERVLPLVEAAQTNDRFAIAELMKQHSPLLQREKLLAASQDQRAQIAKAQAAVQTLSSLMAGSDSDRVTFLQVLRCVAHNELFDIPEPLLPFVEDDASRFEEDYAEQPVFLHRGGNSLKALFPKLQTIRNMSPMLSGSTRIMALKDLSSNVSWCSSTTAKAVASCIPMKNFSGWFRHLRPTSRMCRKARTQR